MPALKRLHLTSALPLKADIRAGELAQITFDALTPAASLR